MDYPWRVKLRRAVEHLSELQTACAAYLGRPDVGLESVYEEANHTLAVRLRIGEPPPTRLSALIGDVLQNLRSALDSIAWATVQRRTDLTAEEEKATYYPITKQSKDWGSARGLLPKVPDTDLGIFERLQPWYDAKRASGEGYDLRYDAERKPLVRLHELAKQDRHRSHHPLVARAGTNWITTPEGVVLRSEHGDPQPFGDGSTLMRWVLPPDITADCVHSDGELFLALSVEDADAQRDIMSLLGSMLQDVLFATRLIEHEVLGVVTTANYEELNRLRSAAEDASERLRQFSVSSEVLDSEALATFTQLREGERAARDRWHQRYQEILA